jgi:hypothetical protein
MIDTPLDPAFFSRPEGEEVVKMGEGDGRPSQSSDRCVSSALEIPAGIIRKHH